MPSLPVFCLLLGTLLVHGAALFGEYVYDDLQLIGRNPAVLQPDLWALATQPLYGQEYPSLRPLLALLLGLGHHLGGPLAIHAAALLLHLHNIVLLRQLAARFLPSQAALWAAALFAVHPLQVESIAFAAAINDPLWLAAVLQACRATLRWRDYGGQRLPWQVVLWVWLALQAKEMAIVAWPLLWLVDRWATATDPVWPQAPTRRRLLLALLLATLPYLLQRWHAFGSMDLGLFRGTAGDQLSTLRLLSAPAELLLRQLELLWWPHPLLPFRAIDPAIPGWATLLWLLAAVGGLLLLWWHCRRAAATRRFALALCLLPLLLPAFGFRRIGAYPLADRYLYASVAGFALVLAPWTQQRHWRWPAWLLLGLAALLSHQQTQVWRDQQSLAAHGLRYAPHDPNLLVMAADDLLQRAQRGAAELLPRARELYATAEPLAASASRADRPHRALSAARLGLAWCGWLQAQHPQQRLLAIAAFQRAVDTDPQLAAAWIGLGVAHGSANQFQPAEQALRRALALEPDNSMAHTNLGNLQLRSRQPAAARDSLQRALQLDPSNATARALLAELPPPR
jgi:tetratricopeptide (TPR) repeat protein